MIITPFSPTLTSGLPGSLSDHAEGYSMSTLRRPHKDLSRMEASMQEDDLSLWYEGVACARPQASIVPPKACDLPTSRLVERTLLVELLELYLDRKNRLPGQEIAATPQLDVTSVSEVAQDCAENNHLVVHGTTLMVYNIPKRYTREMLLQVWPNGGTYDIFYLPYDCRLCQHTSKVFINFTSVEAAQSFANDWHRRRLPGGFSKKPLCITHADVQGLEDNLRHFRKKRLFRSSFERSQPALFKDGNRVSLAQMLDRGLDGSISESLTTESQPDHEDVQEDTFIPGALWSMQL